MRVGFVGLGNQGAPMAHRIVAAGWECAVWARRPDAVDPFRDGPARVAESLPDLGRELDLLCCCVFDAAGTREVLFGPRSAARSMPRGAAIAIHSTVGPREAQDLAEDARRLGLDLIDAPVSGGAGRAAKGELVTMVGADTASWKRHLPVFEAFSSLVVNVGAVGAGQQAKLLNNAMLTAHLGIAHDAFEIAARLGLNRSALENVLLSGSGRSYGAEMLIAAEGMTGIARSQARPALSKDVRLLLEAVRDGAPGGAPETTVRSDALLLRAAQRTIERIEDLSLDPPTQFPVADCSTISFP
jgi:3-hydroxyisobutyrate dehydrogenase